MGVPGNANPLLLRTVTAAATGIRSLRFNSADSAYLSRTPASAGNRKTWTWAAWVKRSKLGSGGYIFSSDPNGSNYFVLYWDTGVVVDALSLQEVSGGSQIAFRRTASVYRDPSAWYHIVLAVDTTQGTASNRIKMYVNGSEITTFNSSQDYSQNADTQINSTSQHNIGCMANFAVPFDGYLADIYLIDGQQLDPTSFGEFDATTGVWNPKAYTGSYGTNGAHLEFADNSNNTAATLGKDTSGNGNNFTPTNLSVTAGAGNDSLVDVPTNGSQTDTGVGGEVRGGYCTLNPLFVSGNTLSNGNLDVTTSTTGSATSVGTIAVSSGKWYWEVTPTTATSISVGVLKIGGTNAELGSTADGYAYLQSGNKYNNGSSTAYGASYTSNDVIGIALDLDAGTLVFYKNNTSQGTAFSSLSGTFYSAVGDYTSGSSVASMNFGQRAFAYTAPSGFKALCTANLPAPSVTKPSTVFDVLTWSGSGGARSFTGLGFSPDLVWGKQRNGSNAHQIYDIVRGAGNNKDLASDYTAAEGSGTTGASAYGYLSSFDSTGFSVANGTDGTFGAGYWNLSGRTYVAWTWDAGSSTVTNTQGSISSQVRANASAGFSICTYSITSASSTISTFGHGLGVAPSFVIFKVRNVADEWTVYHGSIPSPTSNWVTLNTTNAAGGGTSTFSTSSTTFGIRETRLVAGGTSGNILAYCFAPVSGYSSFGSYTGNGSSDGPFVFCGFRPRWILQKETSASGNNWRIFDTARDTYNAASLRLFPNLSNAESTLAQMDILSNGFKIRDTDGSVNANGNTYIYAAFAESPFNYSRAR